LITRSILLARNTVQNLPLSNFDGGIPAAAIDRKRKTPLTPKVSGIQGMKSLGGMGLGEG